MIFKNKFIILFILSSIYVFPAVNIDYNDLLKNNDSQTLSDLFTLNVGIMNFKSTGNINLIDPLDSQNVVNTIKIVLDKVPSVRLDKKEAAIKAETIYFSKLTDEKEKLDANLMKDKLFYVDKNKENNIIYEMFLLMKKQKDFSPIVRKWFENIDNPFYALNLSKPFDRIFLSEDKICEQQKSNDRGPLDILIHGEIERIDKIYFITIFVYSNLLQKRIKEISYVSDSENLSIKTEKEFSSIISSIFKINYASLSIETKDKDAEIYLNSNYLGKDAIKANFIVPGNYILTIKKQDYEDYIENINLADFQDKELSIAIDKKVELQKINLNIEPYGTKIFINALYKGKSPLKLALKKGSYIISAKNDLYESYRYILKIDEINSQDLNVVFHLKSKDPYDFFKIKKYTYYAAFWNFTFSLITMIPLIIFAVDQWERYGYAISLNGTDYQYTATGQKMNLTTNVLYGVAAGFVAHTILSAGWLFYALADYLLMLEKRDFLPIIDFYKNEENKDTVSLGVRIKFN